MFLNENHYSWNYNTKYNIFNKLDEYKKDAINTKYIEHSKHISENQHDIIPIYDNNGINLSNKSIQEDIYKTFFDKIGTIIIKNMYSKETMDEYNKWCEITLDEAKKDGNCRHPKQKKKYLINDVIGRMSKSNPELLWKLIGNKSMNQVIDILLGFSKFGSCTAHWIEPEGDRQISHVDYPIHVGSGPFWEESIEKVKNLTTEYQLNNILPYYSVQLLIASDSMSIKNGSTEIVPCSHRLPNLDILLHDKDIYHKFEKYFVNVELNQGDILLFCRRLCHRGGKNLSLQRRNSLIIQCVWFWGIGQEIIEADDAISQLEKVKEFTTLNNEEKEKFILRMKHPYPSDIKKKT